jgi:hypothetical protein
MVHWLRIGGMKLSTKSEQKQWNSLKEYLNNYPGSKIIVFNKNTGDAFAKIVRLECDQTYKELDLDCNSCYDTSIKHLSSKPADIEVCKMQLDYFVKRGW